MKRIILPFVITLYIVLPAASQVFSNTDSSNPTTSQSVLPIINRPAELNSRSVFNIEIPNNPNSVTSGVSSHNTSLDKDNTTFDVNLLTSNTPLEELALVVVLDEPRPNPAKGSAWIGYQLPDQAQNAQLVVRSLLGSIVINEKLDANPRGIRMDVSNLNNGIYIYSLIINNNPVKSKRLVVAN